MRAVCEGGCDGKLERYAVRVVQKVLRIDDEKVIRKDYENKLEWRMVRAVYKNTLWQQVVKTGLYYVL